MAKLTDIRDRFRDAVTAHGSLRTFYCGPAGDMDRLLKAEMPLFILEIPEDSEVTDWKRSPFETWSMRAWVVMTHKMNEREEDVVQKLEWMRDWFDDILDVVISKATLPASYDIASGVTRRNWVNGFTHGTMAVMFEFDLMVKDCRNKS